MYPIWISIEGLYTNVDTVSMFFCRNVTQWSKSETVQISAWHSVMISGHHEFWKITNFLQDLQKALLPIHKIEMDMQLMGVFVALGSGVIGTGRRQKPPPFRLVQIFFQLSQMSLTAIQDRSPVMNVMLRKERKIY